MSRCEFTEKMVFRFIFLNIFVIIDQVICIRLYIDAEVLVSVHEKYAHIHDLNKYSRHQETDRRMPFLSHDHKHNLPGAK